MQAYIGTSLSALLCLLHVIQQVCNAGEAIQPFSSGQLCWTPLDFSSNTLPPGQPRQESTSCTSLRAASAGYCMDQHKWLSWKRLLALAPRQRYLGRGAGVRGGENGRSEENRPVKATLTVREERTGAGEELLGLGLALSRCERQHPQTLESPASVGCNLPPKAKQPAPPAPPPRPAPPLRPGVFRSREKRAPITKSEIRTQKWGGGGGGRGLGEPRQE